MLTEEETVTAIQSINNCLSFEDLQRLIPALPKNAIPIFVQWKYGAPDLASQNENELLELSRSVRILAAIKDKRDALIQALERSGG
jgi:hypothetical protein